MESDFKAFERKVKDRQFAIENSWRRDGAAGQAPEGDIMEGLPWPWETLNENLEEADASRNHNDGYFPLQSRHKLLGPVILFYKRAVRKLLKVFLGWYLFPIYERQSYFNGKILNAATSERDMLLSLRKSQEAQAREILALQRENAWLKGQIVLRDNLPTDDDEFYHHFEEKFRGEREEIKNRLRVYVPMLRERLPRWESARFVDVGSGRGEWLDILRENGAADYVGVDLNERQNKVCECCGHRPICMDAVAYLAEQPDESVDLITGFQLIEHLRMSDIMELLRQSYRVLKRGGMILFETQNPRNLVVGADTFYIDPSHMRPLDPNTVTFMAQWNGFGSVRCIDANAAEKWAGIPLTEENAAYRDVVEKINEFSWLLYGPQDYALFAVKE